MRASVFVFAFFLTLNGCSTARTAEPKWTSPLHGDHPLVGRVWDVRAASFTSLAQLEERAGAAHWVLLGETHDNPDHHALQARLVRAIVAGRRQPSLVFEMLEVSQQHAVNQARSKEPKNPDAIAAAVNWERSGWPDFAMYRPVFQIALESGLPIVAGNVPKAALRAAMKGEMDGIDPEVRARLERKPPMSPELLAELSEEMRVAHCGQRPEGMMAMFVLAQRLRDAQLAHQMRASSSEDGAVLIAGAGHTRVDRGVPSFLDERARLSVAFIEVRPDASKPADYIRDRAWDYVVFTPAVDRPDPCEAMRAK